jgi:hypothetical protein
MELCEKFWDLENQYFEDKNQNVEIGTNSFEGTTIYIPPLIPIPQQQDIISLQIHELKENGIMNPIGGELWEASILLCCLIMRNEQLFLDSCVLELGSGLGIPSILLLILKQRYLKKKLPNSSCGSVFLTDYDDEVLHNLKYIVKSHIPGSSEFVLDCNFSSSFTTHIQKLDWNEFLEENSFVSLENDFRPSTIPRCDLLIGSELVYTDTQQGLSSLILYHPPLLLRLTSLTGIHLEIILATRL